MRRLEDQRPGDGDALPLAARELVRIAKPVLRQTARHRRSRPCTFSSMPAIAMDDQRLAQDVVDRLARMQRGVGILEDELHAAGGQPGCAWRPGGAAIDSQPRCRVEATRPAMAFSTVDLPEPDSPTMPKVSPAATSKETPRTAWIGSSAVAEGDGEILDRDHASHSGSRVTVASSARGTSSEGAAAISARV